MRLVFVFLALALLAGCGPAEEPDCLQVTVADKREVRPFVYFSINPYTGMGEMHTIPGSFSLDVMIDGSEVTVRSSRFLFDSVEIGDPALVIIGSRGGRQVSACPDGRDKWEVR